MSSSGRSRLRRMIAINRQDEDVLPAGKSLQLSVLLGAAALVIPEFDRLGPAEGTIDASIEAVKSRFYGDLSETLIRGVPVKVPQASSDGATSQSRAKDLIAELNAINLQIHRMMIQVERAVARLATS